MKYTKIPAVRLYQFTEDVFASLGYARADAARAAAVLHYADLRGHDTHGVANLASLYSPAIQSGEIRLKAAPRWQNRRGACGLLNADGALGLLAAQEGMLGAITSAREAGIGCVAVTNSSHFGAAGFYAHMALEHGMLGIASTNLGNDPVANPMGSVAPLLGTNPISFSAGTGNGADPFLLDMSTTVVASGKIKQYARRGQSVPDGWLHDAGGRVVSDPSLYASGQAQLPMLGGAFAEQSGHKGLGLGLMVEVLCGALAGAHTSADRGVGGRNSVGHFFIAITPSFFGAQADFDASMTRLLGSISDAPVQPDFAPMMYPGQPDGHTMRERLEKGIGLDAPLLAQLNGLAKALNLASLNGERA